MMAGFRSIQVAALALALAACDNTPNKAFEQSARDRDAARAGDRYSSLEASPPRDSTYANLTGRAKRNYAADEARKYRSTYEGLLGTLEADTTIDRSSSIFSQCRAAYHVAVRFGSDQTSGLDPSGAASTLSKCRNDAHGARSGTAKPIPSELLSRFASAGILLVGVTAVGRGNEAAGLKIWHQGEALQAHDKPGFTLNAKSFLN